MSEDGVALVTGGSRGIGAAIARRLGAGGRRVALTYRVERTRAEAVAREIGELGGCGTAFRVESRDAAAVRAVVAQVERDVGPVEVLVNNIGVVQDGLAAAMGDEFWDVLSINLRSTLLFTQAAVGSMMRRRSGRIVNITSTVARNPESLGQCNYVTAKAAVHSFTRSLALELASRNITVNAVAPGLILTDLSRTFLSSRRDVTAAIPAGRLGEADEVASLVEFLASGRAAYITGEVIGVTGGLCL